MGNPQNEQQNPSSFTVEKCLDIAVVLLGWAAALARLKHLSFPQAFGRDMK